MLHYTIKTAFVGQPLYKKIRWLIKNIIHQLLQILIRFRCRYQNQFLL